MDSLEVKQWVNANKQKFPVTQIELVSTPLDRMEETTFRATISQKFKSPAIAFVLAFFLPGTDRFYLGDILNGILQILVLNWITFGIYPVYRWFVVCNETKEKNVEKITQII